MRISDWSSDVCSSDLFRAGVGAVSEHLLLKWGTLKGWNLGDNAAAREAAVRYEAGGMSMSAMAQHDTPEQKQALCDLIDAINGPITTDWSGETKTKNAAKKYVPEYEARAPIARKNV